MKILKYMKYVLVVLLALGSICVLGVWHGLGNNNIQSDTLENEKKMTTIALVNQIEIPREYTTYTSEIEFMDNYFKGIQTINYVHEFNKSVNEILIKLYLNKPKDALQVVQKGTEIEQHTSNIETECTYLTKVLVNGESASFRQDGANAWIKLSTPLEPGQSISIGMSFRGSLVKQKDGTMYTYNILPQVGVFNDATGWAQENYNIEENSYLEVADYNLTAIVPNEIFPICTGNLVEKYETEENNIKYTYEAKKVRGVGIYLDKSLKAYKLENDDGMHVVVYSNRILDKDIILMREQEAFKYYANIFGRYPYDRFIIIDREEEIPIAYPQMAIIDLHKADTHYELMYQAIGKQWLPYIIGHEPKKDLCLNVGLEAYIAKRRTNSIETMKKYLENINANTYKNENEKTKYGEDYYSNAYTKPMKLFLEIEDTIGTQAWEECLRNYYQKKSFKISKYNDFISIILQDNSNIRWLLDDYTHLVTNGKEERQ